MGREGEKAKEGAHQGLASRVRGPCVRSRTSAARIRTARRRVSAAVATCISAAGRARASGSAWCTAALASGPSPSARAPSLKAPSCPRRRSSPSWSTSKKGAAHAPPAGWFTSGPTPSRATPACPAGTARQSTTRSRLFPPRTREVQLDEKWSFVAKKEKSCDPADPADALLGDRWDHTAVDAESRLVLAVVPGERTLENCQRIVDEVKRRTGGRTDLLLTSDEHKPYATAIEAAYAREEPVPRRPGPGRPPKPRRVMPADLCYATVCKRREEGRVVEVTRRLVFGMVLCWMLLRSKVSRKVNTAIVERNNGTDRRQNGRKHRKTYGFSKDRAL